MVDFIDTTVRAALEEVAEEFRGRSMDVEVRSGEGGRVWPDVLHGSEHDFYYGARPRTYTPPAFAMRDTQKKRGKALKFYRAEVYLSEGGQDYDLMGWTREQIITDVIDHYEKHMHFLHILR